MSSSTSTGISRSTAESIARSAAREALREAQRYTDQNNEIMRDIDQMSRSQRSIETQTAAIIASVGTTTAAVISTKDEVEQAKGKSRSN